MSIPEGEQFEKYLRRFRPFDAEPLPIAKTRTWQRPVVFAATAVAAAAILAVAVLTIQPRHKPAELAHRAETSPSAERQTASRMPPAPPTSLIPLTSNTASALLSQSSSTDELVERLIVQSQPVPIPKGKHSALAVLSQEEL